MLADFARLGTVRSVKITFTIDSPKPHTGEHLHVISHVEWKEGEESLAEFEERAVAEVKRHILNARMNTKKPEDPYDPGKP